MRQIELLLLIFFGLVLGLSLPAQQQAAGTPLSVILDMDLSVDDWLAALYLLQNPDVRVLAVTVSGDGMTTCGPGVRNAMNLVALAGDPDIPVACGRETPLLGSHAFPQAWRDQANQLGGVELPDNPVKAVDQSAVELLRQTLHDSVDKITVVALGPPTNIAELLRMDPSAAEHIGMLYLTVGAVDVGGDVFENGRISTEWNACIDPQAMKELIEFDVPITLVPLDAGKDMQPDAALYRRLFQDRMTPEADFVYKASAGFMTKLPAGYPFWAALTAVVATDERVVTIEERTIRVTANPGGDFGHTLDDPAGNWVRVAVRADRTMFERVFLNVLNGRSPEMVPLESATELTGTWCYDQALFHFQFMADGTYRANQSLEGLYSEMPEDQGTYTLKDSVLTLTSGEQTLFCAGGDVGVYHLFLTADGQLSMEMRSDSCRKRHPGTTAPQVFAPVADQTGALNFPLGVLQGGSYEVTFRADGTYVFGMQDGDFITDGSFLITDETLVWTSDSHLCSNKATYQWEYTAGVLRFRLLGDDPCAQRVAALTPPFYTPAKIAQGGVSALAATR